jgi:hypothetical protein
MHFVELPGLPSQAREPAREACIASFEQRRRVELGLIAGLILYVI